MRKSVVLSALITLSIFGKAQTTKIVDRSIPFKITEIAAQSFEIKHAETAYDLAINLSYFHHISNKLKNEYLILPIITINDSIAYESSLKKINISEISEYQFRSGIATWALYGMRGMYGLLNINLKKDKLHGENKE